MGTKNRKKMKFLLATLALAIQADPGVTTHVLDTAIGLPGQGVKVNVYQQRANRPLDNDRWELVRTVHTNSDGRTDSPVIDEDEFMYFLATSDQFFKVRQDQANEHFHVPILCTPYSYSTYRGS